MIQQGADLSQPLRYVVRVTVTLSGVAGRADLEQTFLLLDGFAPLVLSTAVVNRTGHWFGNRRDTSAVAKAPSSS